MYFSVCGSVLHTFLFKEVKMEFWSLIEEGRRCFKKEMFAEAELCFEKAEKLRPDGKYLVEMINSTENFDLTDIDFNNLNSLDTQEYILNLKALKILKEDGVLNEDIYEYIANQLPVINDISI